MKVKGYELIKMISNRELKQGTKIKFDNMIFLYDYPNLSGIYRIGTDTSARNNLFYFLDCSNISKDFEILEDKTEEIEELDTLFCMSDFTDIKYCKGEIDFNFKEMQDKINELVREVNTIKKILTKDTSKETNCMTD